MSEQAEVAVILSAGGQFYAVTGAGRERGLWLGFDKHPLPVPLEWHQQGLVCACVMRSSYYRIAAFGPQHSGGSKTVSIDDELVKDYRDAAWWTPGLEEAWVELQGLREAFNAATKERSSVIPTEPERKRGDEDHSGAILRRGRTVAKSTVENLSGRTESIPSSSSPEGERQEQNEDKGGTRLVTILYSRSRDLYRVPSIDKPCWLSVMAYPMPMTQLPPDAIYFGPSMTADELHWRKAYASAWRTILPGDHATVPADDPMVLDYAAFSTERSSVRHPEPDAQRAAVSKDLAPAAGVIPKAGG